MSLLLEIHGFVRWLVLLAGVAGLLHAMVAFSRFAAGTPRPHRILAGAFTGLMDLQLLLGIVLLIGLPAARSAGLTHALLMLAAVALAHILSVRSRRVPAPRRVAWAAAVFVGPLALILAGLAALPNVH